jgi:hypothetical protein
VSHLKIKISSKKSGRQRCAEEFISGVEGLKLVATFAEENASVVSYVVRVYETVFETVQKLEEKKKEGGKKEGGGSHSTSFSSIYCPLRSPYSYRSRQLYMAVHASAVVV